jgi:negative regulator of sigma-B (phosphoserine phosphatase)
MPGERQNGDAVLLRQNEAGETMLAVIDGLGHGPDAAVASRAAIELLTLMPVGARVAEAMQEIHRGLRGTRGAAATLCVIKEQTLEICAVGNVALMCTNCVVPLVLSAGVLGHQVAKFRVSESPLKPGARLALLSDGVSTRFRLEELRHLTPPEACEFIMSRYRRKEDDATVLVADVSS